MIVARVRICIPAGIVDKVGASTLEQIAQLLVEGHIESPPLREYALNQAAEVHRIIQGGHNRGKIVLRVQDL